MRARRLAITLGLVCVAWLLYGCPRPDRFGDVEASRNPGASEPPSRPAALGTEAGSSAQSSPLPLSGPTTDAGGCPEPTSAEPSPKPEGIVAWTGDRLPDGDGRIADVLVPTLNERGDVAFGATVEGACRLSRFALLRSIGGNLAIIAREGAPAPGLAGAFRPLPGDALGPFRGAARLDDLGNVAFLGAFAPEGRTYAEALGIFAQNLALGLGGTRPAGLTDRTLDFEPEMSNPPVVSPGGAVAFTAGLAGEAGREGALFLWRAGKVDLVARTGDTVEGGRLEGEGEDVLGIAPPDFAHDTRLVFTARYRTGQGGLRSGLFLWPASEQGGIERLLGSGDLLPDGQRVTDVYDLKHAPDANQLGEVALLVSTEGGAASIVIVRPAGREVVARLGDSAPQGGYFSHLRYQPALTDDGRIAFGARLVPSPGATLTTGEGLFVGRAGALAAVALRGQRTPEGDAIFEELVESDRYLQVNAHRPSLNGRGQMAFMAGVRLDGGQSRLGLYVHDGSQIHKVVRQGDLVAGKAVADIRFLGVTSGGARGFNDRCEVAYVTLFEDQTSALWVRDACRSGRN